MVIIHPVFSQNKDTAKYSTEEISVMSNKVMTDIFYSPSKIQVLERKDIENKNGETLSDILQTAGAVFLKVYGGTSSLSTISTNGLGSEHTLVLINGFKINSSQNAQIDLSTVSKDNIERVEIMNNGSSSIYGSEAIGGVINIITKTVLEKDIHLKVNGQIGSYNQRKIRIEGNKKFNEFNFNMSFSKEASLNNYDYYFKNGPGRVLKERQNSKYNIDNYFLNLIYGINSKSRLSLTSNYSEIIRNIPGIEAGSAPSEAIQADDNWNNILSYENTLSENVFIKSQVNYQNNLSHYDNQLFTNSFYKNIYISNASQINFSGNNFEIIPGYELSYATLKSNEVNDEAKRFQTGLFCVSEFTPVNFLTIYPSARYDHISDLNRNVFSGKLGFNIKPVTDVNWNFKAGIGNNYASPTFNELYWKELGNRHLKPESSLNIDAGMIFGFDLFAKTIIELTYTNIEAKDKIVWSPNSNGLWTPKNIGRSVSNVYLFEINTGKQFSKQLFLNAGFKYSFTNSVKKSFDFTGDPSYGKQIFYIPEQLAKCNISLRYNESSVNIFYSFTGKRYTDFENKNFLTAADMFEINFSQNIRFGSILSIIKLEINNLFNEDYQIISGYPMPLRNYKINLSLEY